MSKFFEPLEDRRLLSVSLLPALAQSGPGPTPAVVAPATPIPTPGGLTLHEKAGQEFTAKLGHFTFLTVDQAISAQINWGDGTHSVGTIEGSYATGKHHVEGTHTYAD